jgi:hypothetical protein
VVFLDPTGRTAADHAGVRSDRAGTTRTGLPRINKEFAITGGAKRTDALLKIRLANQTGRRVDQVEQAA